MKPIRALMWCPKCGRQHIDEGEWATREHKKHRCVGEDGCGHEWTPLEGVATVGVAKLDKLTVVIEGLKEGRRPGYAITAREVAETLIVPEYKAPGAK